MAKQTAAEVLSAHIQRISDSIEGKNNFLRAGKYYNASDAVKAAKKAQNVQTQGQSALKEGDVFTVPAGEEFDKVFFGQTFSDNQENPSFFIAVTVTRGDAIVPINVFSTAFTRGIYEATAKMQGGQPVLDEEGNPEYNVATSMSYPSGKPAEDVRNTPGSIYDAMLALAGKTIKVTDRTAKQCRRLKRGATRNAGGTFDDDQFEIGNQNVLSFEYVEKTSGK